MTVTASTTMRDADSLSLATPTSMRSVVEEVRKSARRKFPGEIVALRFSIVEF